MGTITIYTKPLELKKPATMSLKGPTPQQHDGSALRVAIVHARWNSTIIEPLVSGAKAKLLAAGVKEDNIVVQSCPGSWELPIAVQRLISASTIQSSQTGAPSATDLLASSTTDLTATAGPTSGGAFDAVIGIGVLIKGETMHFEYIADAAVHGLMRVQLDTGIPVILGILTVPTRTRPRRGLGWTVRDITTARIGEVR